MNYEDMIRTVIKRLEGKNFADPTYKGKSSREVYEAAISWIKKCPSNVDYDLKRQLVDTICKVFGVQESDIYLDLAGRQKPKKVGLESRDRELEAVLPDHGWFHWVKEFTRYVEPPLSFHIFGSMCLLGAALGRRVYLDMGFFKIYPNYRVVLVGPTGNVKKTVAVDIVTSLVKEMDVCPILAEKITPSRLGTVLAKKGGHHFIYAPEFSSFFDRQKFNEGLTITIIRLLDCPSEYKIETQAREEEIVTDVALTIIGGTTPELLSDSTPREVVQSGFINRFLWVVEDVGDRCFALARRGDEEYEVKIREMVDRFKRWVGTVSFTEEGWRAYEEWYRSRKERTRVMVDEVEREAIERGPDHMLRSAMIINLAYEDSLHLTKFSIDLAIKLVEFTEAKLPGLLKRLKHSGIAHEADVLVKTLEKMGGASDHSTLLRRLSHKFTAQQLQMHVNTLEQAGMLRVEQKGLGKYYILRKEE